MVFNLVSHDTGLEIVAISYHLTLLDRCCEICCTLVYKNSSSIPINVCVEKDVEIDLGSLFCLESKIGGVIVLEQSSKYSELLKENSSSSGSSNSSNNNCIDLLPEKEVVLNTKYIKELTFKDKIISLRLPYRCNNSNNNSSSKSISIDIKVDGQFSSNVKSVKCPTHPASLCALNIEDNIVNSEYQFTIEKDKQIKDFCIDIEIQELPLISGWITDAINYEGSMIKSSMISFNTNIDIVNLTCTWTDSSITKLDKLPRSSSSGSHSNIYNLEKLTDNNNNSTNNNDNQKVTISYNDQTNCCVTLRKTSSLIIYRFSTLSKLKKQIEDSSSTKNLQDISFLIKLFLENNTIKSPESLPTSQSPLSFSAPDNFNCNISSKLNSSRSFQNLNSINNSTKNFYAGPNSTNAIASQSSPSLQTSGDLLSNLSTHPKVKPSNLQSFTAPPSFNKDLSNPIAAFVSNRQAGGGAASGPAGLAKTKRTPPTLASLATSKEGAPVDIRTQRLASYNKVNQLFSKPTRSDFARSTIAIQELEAAAFDIALQHIRTNWWKRDRLATLADVKKIRSIVINAIKSEKIEITFVTPPPPAASPQKTPPPSLNGSMTDLKSLLAPKPQPQPTTTTIAPPQQDNGEKAVDIDRLKWIIEELLDEEKKSFSDSDADCSRLYRVCTAETTGQRPQMEDKHVIIEQPDTLYGLSDDSHPCDHLYVGIFDGHSGSIAAEYTRTNLAHNIFSRYKFNHSSNPLESIHKGYVDTNNAFLDIAERDDRKAGSTVATAILLRDKVYISNLGDSEVILCSNGLASVLTTSHTPKNETERARVEKAGGTIIQYGTLRVNGVLSVTRAIGDRSLKDLILAEPSNHVHSISSSDQFILMATDGLWDVFTYQEVADFILNDNQNENNNNESNNNNSSNNNQTKELNVADRLIEEALRRNSKDNITVAIIYLNSFK